MRLPPVSKTGLGKGSVLKAQYARQAYPLATLWKHFPDVGFPRFVRYRWLARPDMEWSVK